MLSSVEIPVLSVSAEQLVVDLFQLDICRCRCFNWLYLAVSDGQGASGGIYSGAKDLSRFVLITLVLLVLYWGNVTGINQYYLH